MEKKNLLLEVVTHKLDKNPPGVFSICSANPMVLNASLKIAKDRSLSLLIESTCNQVNQFGGYMNMTPTDFIKYIKTLATNTDFPEEKIYLGGDHLGPSLWTNESAETAMAKAKRLVQDYVLAGYNKIHLDTSMACIDDILPLPKQLIANRQAQLCQVAEEAKAHLDQKSTQLLYVVGTEVPIPGGAMNECDLLEVTSTKETIENIQMTKEVFHEHGLDTAWERTIAFVVQPGVEFSDTHVHAFDRNKASALSELIKDYNNLVYESHSTDYQSRIQLKEMVEDHFAILKVGPALTFAMREAIFSLALIEKELLFKRSASLSHVTETLDQAMIAKPVYWDKYYSGSVTERGFKRKYSFSDRCRYYWSEKQVTKAVHLLIDNLSNNSIPLSLISQYLPIQYEEIRAGELLVNPLEMIYSKVNEIIKDYIFACNLDI
ncbi:MAG: class II D-tagatose-bisphosphate aldolase, non-catalytic subunit [Pelolinea sp.]|nr:class II D-tagatose-bisphosphate aldolase, non-catalytic subunit [Pelolinea sp.]